MAWNSLVGVMTLPLFFIVREAVKPWANPESLGMWDCAGLAYYMSAQSFYYGPDVLLFLAKVCLCCIR